MSFIYLKNNRLNYLTLIKKPQTQTTVNQTTNIIQVEKSINYIKNIQNNEIGLIIPFYQYPYDYNKNDFVDDVYKIINVKNKYDISIIVIVNPNNGAGSEYDDKYDKFIKLLNKNGIYVSGYVYTNYLQRDINQVKTDIEKWKTLYPIVNSIFIDELIGCGNNTITSFDIINYINSLINYGNLLKIEYFIGNFGTLVCNDVLPNLKLNNFLIFEDYFTNFDDYIFLNILNNTNIYSKYNFSIILHSFNYTNSNTPIYDNIQIIDLFLNKIKNIAGYVYITDNIEYNRLPQYFEDFCLLISNIKNKKYVEYLIQKYMSIYSNNNNINYDMSIFNYNNTTRFLTLKDKSIKSNHLDDNIVDNNTIEFNIQKKISLKNKSIKANHLSDNIDASNIGFNSDKVDGYDVNNNDNLNDVIWTSSKIKKEIFINSILFG